MKVVDIDGSGLTRRDALAVARGTARLVLSESARVGVDRSRSVIEEIVQSGQTTYGINTGFGHLCDTSIDAESLRALQVNLVRSHACGVGEVMHPDEVLLMMVMRANSLAKGHSGIRASALDMLIGCINAGIAPRVPRTGSLGASGDLAPLAHMALGLIGEGDGYIRSTSSQRHGDFAGWRLTQMSEALKLVSIAPLELAAKEGLSLINGTSQMSAWLAITSLMADDLSIAADAALAASIEAIRASARPFHPALHQLRPHPGQIRTAARVRRHLADSEIMDSHSDCDRVQDAYAFRCAPQVHGAVLERFERLAETILIEINSATDNPLVLSADDQSLVISGGNFHGEVLAMSADETAIALHELASISERRIDRILDHSKSGHPPFLAVLPGIESGLMILQYICAAVIAEMRVHATPSSTSNIPVSAGQEDHVSMGATAAWSALLSARSCALVIAGELITATAAIDLIEEEPGRGVQVIHRWVRGHVSPHTCDRPLGGDIERLAQALLAGQLTAVLE